MSIYLQGLRAKIAERHERRRRAKPGDRASTALRFKVPQTNGGKRETREERRQRLDDRREHYGRTRHRAWFAKQLAEGKRVLPASINPRTGKSHEHRREIARRLSRAAS